MASGLFEVRSSLPGRKEARLRFFQHQTALVIVGGFFKKNAGDAKGGNRSGPETKARIRTGMEELMEDEPMPLKRHPNAGPSLEDFLREDARLEEASATAIKRVIAWQLQNAMQEQKISKTAMAARMATSRRQLDRVLNPEDGNVTIETLQRAARTLGRTVRLELV